MSTPPSYDAWPGPARSLARAVDVAVRAALDGDAHTFAETQAELRRSDPDVIAVLLGTITQDLLERVHPDGLDSDDAEQVLAACERGAGWYADYESDLAALALISALGMVDPEQSPQPGPAAIGAHGLLLIASLLPAPTQLTDLVESAMRELHRAQTVELP